jgi:uncharacterized CHY-type Zn-finger protein
MAALHWNIVEDFTPDSDRTNIDVEENIQDGCVTFRVSVNKQNCQNIPSIQPSTPIKLIYRSLSQSPYFTYQYGPLKDLLDGSAIIKTMKKDGDYNYHVMKAVPLIHETEIDQIVTIEFSPERKKYVCYHSNQSFDAHNKSFDREQMSHFSNVIKKRCQKIFSTYDKNETVYIGLYSTVNKRLHFISAFNRSITDVQVNPQFYRMIQTVEDELHYTVSGTCEKGRSVDFYREGFVIPTINGFVHINSSKAADFVNSFLRTEFDVSELDYTIEYYQSILPVLMNNVEKYIGDLVDGKNIKYLSTYYLTIRSSIIDILKYIGYTSQSTSGDSKDIVLLIRKELIADSINIKSVTIDDISRVITRIPGHIFDRFVASVNAV